MEDVHRNAIQINFVSLVEQTDLDLMVSALYEKGVFSEPMIEPYRDQTRDQRNRKRQLYMDIMRRGPDAFRLLIETLTEAGYWDLVRELDPDSSLHTQRPEPRPILGACKAQAGDSSFVSLSDKKKKSRIELPENKPYLPVPPHNVEPKLTDPTEIPHFDVIKSTRFFEDGKYMKLYKTRGAQRGVLVVLSYINFQHNIEDSRSGVDVDCAKLKYLFSAFGFEVVSYKDLTKKETLEVLGSLKEGAYAGVESLFLVVSSHGYERFGSSDTDIRCSDGQLITFYEIIEHFNNKNFPELRGIPKVFVLQVCRGPNSDYSWVPAPTPMSMPEDRTQRDGAPRAAVPGHQPRHMPLRHAAQPYEMDRVYSDILIAHSTLPGYVSHRDGEKGSWYIQALCEVFAAHAHDTHVERLFTLVDERLRERFRVQTSSVDKWGFNRKLYLHPGLVETGDSGADQV